jgi:hypothetical protein
MLYTVTRYYPCYSYQYLYLKSVATGLSKADYKLLCHVVASTLSYYRRVHDNHHGWLPIAKRFIQDKFRTAVPEHLAELGLIRIDRSYTKGRHPRSYRVEDWLIDGYIQAIPYESPSLVNLFDGKPIKPTECHRPKTSHPGLPPPSLIIEAIQCFQQCLFNLEAILSHLTSLQRGFQINPTPNNRFRFINDWTCFDAVDKWATPFANLPGIYTFAPHYTVQATGRIGTALQSCSRAMKAAAFASIPDAHNYDLSSSQVVLTLRELQRRGIACQWLEDYTDQPELRATYAHYVGISEDAWKECLCTALMGGHVPNSLYRKSNAILKTLEESLPPDQDLKAGVERLRETIQPLLKPLKAWHRLLESEVKQAGALTNALGITRHYEEFKSNKVSGIVAHLLQGQEAYFIHTLTTLGTKHGFQPMGNEHDGLITLGKIPEQAIKEAQQLTGLDCLRLREKPFKAI